MFNFSMKILKSRAVLPMPNAKSKKKSKFSNLIPLLFKSKADLSIIDLGPISINSMKDPSSDSQPSVVLSLIENTLKKRETTRIFYQFFNKIVTKIPVGLGVFGGMYALYQILSPSNNVFNEDLELLECFSIIY